ncbi:MAG: hypothetical protein ABIM82_07725, partial [candidate division WOR-3 bacterium]
MWVFIFLIIQTMNAKVNYKPLEIFPPYKMEVKSGFDSLNVHFIGNWPFGPSYAVTFDPLRNLIF